MATTQPAKIWLVAVTIAACALGLQAIGADVARAGVPCAGADTASSQLSQGQARRAVRCLINQKRAGQRQLRLRRKLNRPAVLHSRKMRAHTCLLHVCPGEPTLTRRLRKYLRGAQRTRFAEVIAVNVAFATPRQIVRQWMTSPPHRKLVLGRFKHLGVGVARGGGLAWYTVVLGWKR